MTIRLFLFDLDGTLVDTAPDLALAVNMVRTARGIAPLPEEELRPYASRGAPGLLGKAMGIGRDDPAFLALRTEFLDNYAAHMTDRSRPFEGVPVMLEALRAAGIRTGVVTNKVEHLALRLTDNLGLDGQLDVVLRRLRDEACARLPADGRPTHGRSRHGHPLRRRRPERRGSGACGGHALRGLHLGLCNHAARKLGCGSCCTFARRTRDMGRAAQRSCVIMVILHTGGALASTGTRTLHGACRGAVTS